MTAPRIGLQYFQDAPRDWGNVQSLVLRSRRYIDTLLDPVDLPQAGRWLVQACPQTASPAQVLSCGLWLHTRLDTLIGMATMTRDYPRPGSTRLSLLFLADEYQGIGLGRLAFEALEQDLVEKHQVREINLGVFTQDAGPLAYWRAMGFAIDPNQPRQDGYAELVKRLPGPKGRSADASLIEAGVGPAHAG